MVADMQKTTNQIKSTEVNISYSHVISIFLLARNVCFLYVCRILYMYNVHNQLREKRNREFNIFVCTMNPNNVLLIWIHSTMRSIECFEKVDKFYPKNKEKIESALFRCRILVTGFISTDFRASTNCIKGVNDAAPVNLHFIFHWSKHQRKYSIVIFCLCSRFSRHV